MITKNITCGKSHISAHNMDGEWPDTYPDMSYMKLVYTVISVSKIGKHVLNKNVRLEKVQMMI